MDYETEWMGCVCSIHRGIKNAYKIFVEKYKGMRWVDQSVDLRIILKSIRGQRVKLWVEFICLTTDGWKALKHQTEWREIWLAERL